jgi:hypothetical protein
MSENHHLSLASSTAPSSGASRAWRDKGERSVIDCNAAVGEGVTWEPKTRAVNYDPADLLKYSAAAGIERSCIMPARNKSYREKNREIARVCEKYPGKFIGFAAHNPQTETGTLQQMLIEEVRSMGLKGVRTDGHPTRELLDAVAELNIPVMYYPVLGVREPSWGPGSAGPQVYTGPARAYYVMAKLYPSVNFILPHLGSYRSDEWWAHIEAIDLAKRLPNVYVETSGVLSHKYLEMAVREVPAGKIVFGSNAPEEDPRVEMYAVKLLKLSNQQEAEVLGGNLLKLLA